MPEYCFVVSIKSGASWLTLSRSQRNDHWDLARAIISQYADSVTFTYFDADAFHAQHSDMVIGATQDPLAYHHLWDRLKDTALFTDGYYTIADVRFGIKGVSHG